MSETTFRRDLCRTLRALDARPMESAISLGVPDINYCCGWIELKYLPHFPVRSNTTVKLPHYTQEQRIWLSRRYRVAKNAFLFLKVGRWVFLLFDGVSAINVGNLTTSELFEQSILYTRKGLGESGFVEQLISTLHPWGIRHEIQ